MTMFHMRVCACVRACVCEHSFVLLCARDCIAFLKKFDNLMIVPPPSADAPIIAGIIALIYGDDDDDGDDDGDDDDDELPSTNRFEATPFTHATCDFLNARTA